jgi:hypothetical protein
MVFRKRVDEQPGRCQKSPGRNGRPKGEPSLVLSSVDRNFAGEPAKSLDRRSSNGTLRAVSGAGPPLRNATPEAAGGSLMLHFHLPRTCDAGGANRLDLLGFALDQRRSYPTPRKPRKGTQVTLAHAMHCESYSTNELRGDQLTLQPRWR